MKYFEKVCFNDCMDNIRAHTHPFFRKNEIVLNILLFIFSFTAYFSVYGLRKPYTVIKYEGVKLWSVEYKIIVLTSQTLGYAISKFFGIRIVPSMTDRARPTMILLFTFIAEVALIIFGAVPAPYSFIPMFFNGLPLGMIWGMTFGYLEGRRFSEILGAGMAVSFIIASGIMKTVARSLLTAGVPENWMPAVAGAIFWPITLISVFFLELVPPPSEKDIELRAPRPPMDKALRRQYMQNFWPGTIITVILYMVLCAFRDFRDNYSVEIWDALGYEGTPSIFTTSEMIIGFCAMIPVILIMFLKSNWIALISYHLVIILVLVASGISSIIFMAGKMDGFSFMIVVGIALFVAYLPFNNIIFDRMIATFKYNTNSNYITVIHEAWGYLASVVILFIKNFAVTDLSWLDFFKNVAMIASFVTAGLMILSLVYYSIKYYQFIKDVVPSDFNTNGGDDNKETENGANPPRVEIDEDVEMIDSL